MGKRRKLTAETILIFQTGLVGQDRGMAAGGTVWIERIDPRITFTWRGEWTAGTVEPARMLFDHELVLFGRGECRVEVDGSAIACPAGTFLIVPPGLVHRSVAGARPVFRSCIHFDWMAVDAAPTAISALPELFDARLAKPPPRWIPSRILHGVVPDLRRTNAAVEVLFQRRKSPQAADRLAARAALLEILVRLFAAEAPTQRRDGSVELAYAAKLVLDGGIARPIAVQAELASLGCSYEHCCRVFARHFGLPPVRYLHAIRIDRAKELLREPEMTVASAAQAVGYADRGYFTRLFRRQTGISPRSYQEQQHGHRPPSE